MKKKGGGVTRAPTGERRLKMISNPTPLLLQGVPVKKSFSFTTPFENKVKLLFKLRNYLKAMLLYYFTLIYIYILFTDI